ncbi:MAG: hypothetical protein IJM34_07105 [Lachnospiraceae bacterium]|nr:hypothetical protein [Lachnospiraceae bacterium]
MESALHEADALTNGDKANHYRDTYRQQTKNLVEYTVAKFSGNDSTQLSSCF